MAGLAVVPGGERAMGLSQCCGSAPEINTLRNEAGALLRAAHGGGDKSIVPVECRLCGCCQRILKRTLYWRFLIWGLQGLKK